ncbi:MAG: sterol desaturase family protein [bacterium]
MQWILDNEITIRLSFFLGIFTIMALWEVIAPRRSLKIPKQQRWMNNIGLVILNTLLLRVLFPTAAVGVALFAEQSHWGILRLYEVPFWLAVPVAVVLLDFAIYLQHVMFHAIPLLWRLHRVHHADLDYDVTTGARFHPIEIILSMLIKFAVIVILGPPLVAVVIFEVALNATAMFNHANARLPLGLDRVLRLFVVTPDMHRVHHSVEDHEANSNFGFNLPWWDRLFGTYKAQPDLGHQEMEIGLKALRDPDEVDKLPGMLKLPFKGDIRGYTLNRRSW